MLKLSELSKIKSTYNFLMYLHTVSVIVLYLGSLSNIPLWPLANQTLAMSVRSESSDLGTGSDPSRTPYLYSCG